VTPRIHTLWRIAVPLLVALVLAGCHNDMYNQPKALTFTASRFYGDSLTARMPVAGTVARGHLDEDEAMYTGKIAANVSASAPAPGDSSAAASGAGEFAGRGYVSEFPMAITRQVLDRGHERFDIYCSPCHGATGDGHGMIVQRGMKLPPTYHQDRLRQAPPGYFYDVISNGFGAMYSYASRIKPADRWAIIAYIRALQLSQNANASDLSQADMKQLNEGGTTDASSSKGASHDH